MSTDASPKLFGAGADGTANDQESVMAAGGPSKVVLPATTTAPPDYLDRDLAIYPPTHSVRGLVAQLLFGDEVDLREPVKRCRLNLHELIADLSRLHSVRMTNDTQHEWSSVSELNSLNCGQATSVYYLCRKCDRAGNTLLPGLCRLMDGLRDSVLLHDSMIARSRFLKTGVRLNSARKYQEALIDELLLRVTSQQQSLVVLTDAEWQLRTALRQICEFVDMVAALRAGSTSLRSTWLRCFQDRAVVMLPVLEYLMDTLPNALTAMAISPW